jgi:hypothetical protein
MKAPAGVRDGLVQELVTWLEAERAAVAAAWAKEGRAPTVTLDRVLAHLDRHVELSPDRPGQGEMTARIRTETRTIEVSPFNFASGCPMAFRSSTSPPVDALQRAYGEDLADGALSAAQRLHGALLNRTESREPDDRLAFFFDLLAGDYLSRLTALSSGEPTLAQAVAESYVDFLDSDDITEVESLPIGGVAEPAALLQVGDAELRPLSAEELGELIMRALNPVWFKACPAWPIPIGATTRAYEAMAFTAFLTLRSRRPKSGGGDRGSNMSRLVLALQLNGYDIWGLGDGASWTEPGPRVPALTGFTVRIPKAPPKEPTSGIFPYCHHLGPQELEAALRLTELIPPRPAERIKTKSDVVLHRFSIAASQEHEAEAVIDYVIALEALFVPPADKTEMAFRFRLNGARYLAANLKNERPSSVTCGASTRQGRGWCTATRRRMIRNLGNFVAGRVNWPPAES